jgi:7,8-dihydropterin-6-yl-methyl-4-(beta-D-ribofuranosyl)aminobenzene 5'-phosphate synthase
MAGLQPVDELEIQVLVDNTTDMLSSTPADVAGELRSAAKSRLRMTPARCLCCAVHGFSCLLTARRGATIRTLLFDTGPEEYAFERNTQRLGVDLGSVDGIMLSHGHWDHAGAMLSAIGLIRMHNGGAAIPYYAHPGMFRSRGMKMPNGGVRVMEDVPSVQELTDHGASVVSSAEPLAVLDDMFHVSGEIPRVTAFERGLPGQVRRTDDGGWEADELLMDERWLGINVAGKGLVVLTACSHAGVVNVLTHARASFPGVPLYMVMGGLHLSGINEEIIPQTVAALKGFGLSRIAAGHCTGWRASVALANAFGEDTMAPTAVGKIYAIKAG